MEARNELTLIHLITVIIRLSRSLDPKARLFLARWKSDPARAPERSGRKEEADPGRISVALISRLPGELKSLDYPGLEVFLPRKGEGPVWTARSTSGVHARAL